MGFRARREERGLNHDHAEQNRGACRSGNRNASGEGICRGGPRLDVRIRDPVSYGKKTFEAKMIKVGEGTGGGMLKNPMPGAPSSWMAYVLVEDVRASTTKAKTLGAKVMKDVTEVPDRGWFSIITDPTGAMLGLWEAKSRS